jgi:hypothetical protein
MISTITDAVLDELREWQNRPLDSVYPVIYLDAIVCKVRHEGQVRNKAAHIAIGVDTDGRKHVLGIWIETAEGAKFWLRVITELRNRSVEDVLFVCCARRPPLGHHCLEWTVPTAGSTPGGRQDAPALSGPGHRGCVVGWISSRSARGWSLRCRDRRGRQ